MKTSKLFITIVILLLFIVSISAQEPAKLTKEPFEQTSELLPYKAKAEFNQDTLQYLEYNFFKRNNQYKGKKVSDVLKDLDLPVLYVVDFPRTVVLDGSGISTTSNISLAVHPPVGDKPNVLEDYYIVIGFEEPLITDEFKKASDYSRENSKPVFTQKLYDYLKDRVVSGVNSNPYIIQKREFLKNAALKDSIP